MSLSGKLVAIGGLLVAVFIASTLARQQESHCDIDRIRLPEAVAPRHYNIRITPDFDTMTFAGEVHIRAEYLGINRQKCKDNFANTFKKVALLSCLLDGDMFRVNRQILINIGEQLQVNKVEVYRLDGDLATGSSLVANFCRDNSNQMLKIRLNSKLRSGKNYQIKFSYSGVIGKLDAKGHESQGYYQSPHLTPNKTSQYINTNTHFFPADARSAYPSFDEPNFKATFQLTVVHKKDVKAISNTAINDRVWDSDTVETRFKRSQLMSTYNFAFAVGHYEMTECAHDSRVKAYTPLGVADRAELVLNTICRAVGEGEQYFKRPFPLEKLDLVLTKAMRDPSRENWGMLVITEDFFLTDEDTTNVLLVEIVKLATHITLHQWWGDLITAKWWDDQWIFDGFTIWQSHWSTAKMFPEFDYDFNYLLRLQSPTLDAQLTSDVHAIKDYQPRTAQAEITRFDTNTFNKAGAIYQMINSIHPNRFQNGLRQLLEEHLYSTADANDWFTVMGSQLGLANMSSIMKTWLDLPGCPLVSVSLTNDNKLEVSQQRFLEHNSSVAADQQSSLWKIPLLINVSDTTSGPDSHGSRVVFEVFDSASVKIRLPGWYDAENPKHFIKVNHGFDGFYRTKYAANLLFRLGPMIQNGKLAPADRFNVLDDYKALFKTGRVTLRRFERVLALYENETHGGVLSGLATVIPILAAGHKEANLLANETARIVYNLFEPTFRKSSFQVIPGQTHANMNGRQDALVQLVAYQHEEVIREALDKFESSSSYLEPFLRKPVYLAVLNHGSDEQFNALIGRLRATKSVYERSIMIAFLSAYAKDADRKTRMSETLTK